MKERERERERNIERPWRGNNLKKRVPTKRKRKESKRKRDRE